MKQWFLRPEGPAVRRPGRKAGIGIAERWSAEGAALSEEISLTNLPTIPLERQTFPNGKWFSWQEGYAAFSVSGSQENAVIEYIRNQAEHYKRRGFQEELLDLLRRHRIEYDPRYVFD